MNTKDTNRTPRTESVVMMAVGPMREYAIIECAQNLERKLNNAKEALLSIAPFILEDDGGYNTRAYQDAIDKVKQTLSELEGGQEG